VDRLLNLLQTSLAARMMVVGLMVGVPTALSIAGVGAAYVQSFIGVDFTEMVVKFFLLVLSLGVITGFGLLYPFECWVIRERALRSSKWMAFRILVYVAVGVPVALIQIYAQEVLIFELTPALRASYSIAAVATFALIAVVFSFSERLLAAVQRREAQLKQQIEMLKIEIDEAKREKQVSEIVETDFFQNLKVKAAAMRAQVSAESVVST
jgi:hypothetical protein